MNTMERRLGTCFSLSLRNFISLFLDITIVSLVFLNLNYSMVVPVNVDLDRVAYLRTLYYSWSAIARMLGVSRSYLYKRTHGNSAFSNPHRSLTDEELEVVLHGYGMNSLYRGEVLIAGFLRSNGFLVPRSQLRATLHRIDADGIAVRSKRRIRRRDYSVYGPHHLWHIDGNHKLDRYGIVVFGGIDGYSRTITFLKAASNNRATTLLPFFKDAVEEFQVPSRVRADGGGENVLIAKFMIEVRGPHRGSFIVGQSKHNTRIERLWGDVTRDTSTFYIDLFRQYTERGMNIDDSIHIFVLQYMFLPRINEALDAFVRGWNNHKVRTEHNRSPLQILYEGLDRTEPPVDIDVDVYGVEDIVVADYHRRLVDPVQCPLLDSNLLLFQRTVAPFRLCDIIDSMFDRYVNAVNLMTYMYDVQLS